ncbi:hypothetical protein OAT67_00780 [Bacteriovoracaceae bacterium]|nr:hypothetical protein [Bacteriovoracaceae bacterium]
MEKEILLLDCIGAVPKTANETIDLIYRNDVSSGIHRRDWKYYLHLNKLFAPLEKKGFIQQVGSKIGPSGRSEKVWGRTVLSNSIAVDFQGHAHEQVFEDISIAS